MQIIRGANTISIIYISVGVMWIFISDRLAIVDSEPYLQTVKGIAYVVITGIVLWIFLRRIERRNKKILDDLEQGIKTVSQTEHRLTEEKNLLRTVIDNLPDYIYVKDLEGRFIVGNDAFFNVVGRPSSEIIGRTNADIFPVEKAELYTKDDLHVTSSGQSIINHEGFIENAEGNMRRILTTKVPLRDKNNTVTAVVGISRDITAIHSKRLHEDLGYQIIDALNKNEDLTNGLRESLRIIGENFSFELAEAWLVDPAKKDAIVLASTWAKDKNSSFHVGHKQRYERGEGLPGQPFQSKKVEIWPEVMNHEHFTRKDRAFGEDLHTGIGIPLIQKDEVVAVFTFLSKKQFDDHLELEKILEQISAQIALHLERKRHETELENKNERISNILESISDGFFAVDNDWTVIYWNNEAEKLLQVRRQDIVGHKLSKFYPSNNQNHMRSYEVYNEVMTEKKNSVVFEEYYDPLNIWLEISVYPSPDGISVFFRDITENRKLREELQLRIDELAISNAELEQFAYIASHDMQEPLRMVTGFLTQLEKKYTNLLDEKGKQYIGFAVDGAARMRRLILDLLEYSKVGKTDLRIEQFNVGELITEIQSLNQRLISEEKAKIHVGEMPMVSGAKSLIQQLFQNLIVNALKYRKTDEDPVISIKAYDEGSFWRFEVSDNGIGIEKDYYDRVFVIFQRLHSKDEYSGTGIGLAICKKIVENHGGRIWVESEYGKGSTFYFTIKK